MDSMHDEPSTDRFAFGLANADVEELRAILLDDCGEHVSLEEAWSRAAGLLALTQSLLDHAEAAAPEAQSGRLEHRPT